MKLAITNLLRDSKTGGVKMAMWSVTEEVADEVTGDMLSETSYGTTEFDFNPEDPNFIPYEELTEETVLNWVSTALGPQTLELIQNELIQKINSKKNPPVLSGTPW